MGLGFSLYHFYILLFEKKILFSKKKKNNSKNKNEKGIVKFNFNQLNNIIKLKIITGNLFKKKLRKIKIKKVFFNDILIIKYILIINYF